MHEDRFQENSGVTVERSITLPADPDTVWRHLTVGDLLGAWMEGDVTVVPRPGGAITLSPPDGKPVWGTVEEVVPGRRIQWTWRTDDGLPTLVEIELVPRDDGTGLTVRETLLPWRVDEHPPRWSDPPGPRAALSAAA